MSCAAFCSAQKQVCGINFILSALIAWNLKKKKSINTNLIVFIVIDLCDWIKVHSCSSSSSTIPDRIKLCCRRYNHVCLRVSMHVRVHAVIFSQSLNLHWFSCSCLPKKQQEDYAFKMSFLIADIRSLISQAYIWKYWLFPDTPLYPLFQPRTCINKSF